MTWMTLQVFLWAVRGERMVVFHAYFSGVLHGEFGGFPNGWKHGFQNKERGWPRCANKS